MGAEQSAEAESRPGEPSAAGRCLAGSEGCAGTAAVEKGTAVSLGGTAAVEKGRAARCGRRRQRGPALPVTARGHRPGRGSRAGHGQRPGRRAELAGPSVVQVLGISCSPVGRGKGA